MLLSPKVHLQMFVEYYGLAEYCVAMVTAIETYDPKPRVRYFLYLQLEVILKTVIHFALVII